MAKKPTRKAPKPASARLVRKQLLLTATQDRWLKRQARATGQAESEIVRAAIDQAAGLAPEAGDWREGLMRCAGTIPDTRHLERTIAENRQRWSKRIDRIREALGDDD